MKKIIKAVGILALVLTFSASLTLPTQADTRDIGHKAKNERGN